MEEENTSIAINTQLSNGSKNYLLETAKWAKILSIIGFICTGLIIISHDF
jgi:hypothetical protein